MPTRYPVKITRTAEGDLEDVLDFIGKDNPLKPKDLSPALRIKSPPLANGLYFGVGRRFPSLDPEVAGPTLKEKGPVIFHFVNDIVLSQ
jgi:plasmid stabilization system protein ParE